jgi:hypothetical protein
MNLYGMNLSRRVLLAAPLLAAAEALPPPAPVLLPREDGLLALTWAGRGSVLLPGGARALRAMALDGLSLLALAVPADAGLSLLALCGLGDARPRLLGLEVLRWRGPDGAHLDTRYAEISDRRRIALRRAAAAPRDRVRWRRAEWIDYLRWSPPLLADAPIRLPPPGTWQAALGGLRARVQDWLATPREALLPADIAALGLRVGALALAVG